MLYVDSHLNKTEKIKNIFIVLFLLCPGYLSITAKDTGFLFRVGNTKLPCELQLV